MNFIPKAIRPRFEKGAQANSEMITHDIFIQLENLNLNLNFIFIKTR